MRNTKPSVRGGRLLAVATLALVATCAGTDNAWAQTTTSYPLSVPDCQTATQLCAVVPTVTVQTESVLMVEFIASPFHCSDVIAHILVDGVEAFVSGPLAPGESTGVQDLGPVSAGSHTLGVLAEGVLGGCNIGFIGSWSGTLNVTTLTTAIPTLSEWAQLVLVALLIGGGALMLRRRSGGVARLT